MRTQLSLIATVVLAACGGGQSPGTPSAQDEGCARPRRRKCRQHGAGRGGESGEFANRKGELQNPDDSTVVFLYYDLSGMKPPIADWVEQDSRVQYAPGIDKPARRTAVKSELESAAAAVRGMGLLRLSMNANLSEYDPSYSEFTVRALAPSSIVTYSALGQKVSVSFRNGRTAQIWRVPAAEAQRSATRSAASAPTSGSTCCCASPRSSPDRVAERSRPTCSSTRCASSAPA